MKHEHQAAGASGRRSRRGAPRPQLEARDAAIELGRSLFMTRYLGIVALAAAVIAVPAMGDRRLELVELLLGLVLPYNVVLHVATRRRGRIPGCMPFTDQLFSVIFPIVEPMAWLPTVVLLTASIGLAVSAFGVRRAMAALLFGVALLIPVGLQTLESSDVAIGVLSYLIGGAILAVAVGVVSTAERRAHRRYTDLVGGLDAVVWEADPVTFTFGNVSAGAERLLGYPLDAWAEPGFWAEHIHDDDRDEAVARCTAAATDCQHHDFEYRMIAADGRVVWIHDAVQVDAVSGTAARLRGVMMDVTERKASEQRIHRYMNTVDRVPFGLLTAELVDDDLRVVAVNPAAATLLAIEPTLIIDQPLAHALPRLATPTLLPRLRSVAAGADAFDIEAMQDVTPDPERVIALRAFPLPNASVGIALDDVTGATLANAALHRRATHDDLTGLPNRTLLRDRLRQALHEGQRTGEPVALMILDLDQFKEVNDALGHQYGDLLLIQVGQRLDQIVRECDTIARLGGDEFALLLTTNATPAGALRVAEKVTTALQQPFEIEGMTLQTNASIGIAVHPIHADTADALTQRADVAMYAAKRSGSRFALYAADDDRSSITRLTLLGEIRQAVDRGEFGVLYQPVVDLKTGRISGAEALVRWNHPEHGVLEPALFIELAEVSGAIQALTRAVIACAVHDLAAWRKAGFELRTSVNLSVRNLYDTELLRWIRTTLHRADVPAANLAFELTESQIMDDMAMAMGVLGDLRAMGIETAIDDFGTGYSSLAYLRELPITEVKIDRSFVTGLAHDAGDISIVRSIVDLAHNLGLGVLAEGAEDMESIEILRSLGCDRVQGYAIGRPMPSDALIAMVQANLAAAAPAPTPASIAG
jgi:diguanylate cyclase (GGDEF)-like protein/PAS domain S-box-containing protein